jgi:molybdenum cofactor cytidylyltransferase
LAAGTSSRLGRPKQLLELGGKVVLQHVLDAAEASSLEEIVLVLGAEADQVRARVRLPHRARVALNRDFQAGQSGSLKAGLAATDPSIEAAVVLLGDQPGVRPDAIDAVIGAWATEPGPIVRAAYGGRPAHPILLARSVWAEAEGVRGDEGARPILAAHPDWVRTVEVGGDPPEDIDTEADYVRIRRAWTPGEP